MRIATLATGGIGGFLAVHLARTGHDVFCVARGAHLDAIRKDGLRLLTEDAEISIEPVLATSDTTEIGPVDAVILGVKGDGLPDAARACLPLIGPSTAVIPFLNGVEASRRLLEFLPGENVANGIAYVSTTIAQPGVISQTGAFARFVFAERNSRASPRIDALRDAIRAAGLDVPDVRDIDREVWTKFVLFAALSGITAAARCTVLEIRTLPELSQLMWDAVAETAALGRARGVDLPDDIEERTLEGFQSLPDPMRASTAVDLEAGRPLETRWLNGAVVRLAEESGVDVPVHRALLALLAPHIAGK